MNFAAALRCRSSRCELQSADELQLRRGQPPFEHVCDCDKSGFLRAPMQSQRRDKEEKDNHDSYVGKKVQGECAEFLFVQFKPFREPRNVGVPHGQCGNPIKQGEEHTNDEAAQKEISEKNNFFALHNPQSFRMN